MNPLLEIQNLQVDFRSELGTATAIKDISLRVNRGELLALVGESGSGKSVTSMSILRLLPQKTAVYQNGKILFSEDGNNTIDLLSLDNESIKRIRGNKVAMIFQEPMTSLNPVFTCGEQVAEAIRLHKKMTVSEAREATLALFAQVKLPDPTSIFNRYPHQLSGGQKQRVMIAMAMSCEPALLICDEPTTALDVTVQKTILLLIKELQVSHQMGVIFITHDLAVVSEIADRAVVMYKGSIVEEGTVTKIFSRPEYPYTKALIACRPSLYPKGTRLPVVADFIGSSTTETKKTTPITETNSFTKFGEVLIEARGLSVLYPKEKNFWGKPVDYTKAVDNVDLSVFKGETLWLVCESGCGKTTLGRCLLKLIEPSGGQVLYNGENLTEMSERNLRKLRKDIQIVFQDPYSSLNPSLTIEDALSEPLTVHGLTRSRSARKDKVVELLEKVDMKAEHLRRYPHEFSGGQRQRIVIARALILNPSFVVCDESVSALDVSVQAQVLNLLSDLKREMGFTILFISHDLSVVHYISDRIAVMQKGQIEELGEASQVYSQPNSEYTKQLIASIPGKPNQSR